MGKSLSENLLIEDLQSFNLQFPIEEADQPLFPVRKEIVSNR